MSYPLTKLEKRCKKLIENEQGGALWGAYLSARQKVFVELLPYIRQREPDLTDHGPDHIINVMENCYDVLGDECCKGTDDTKSFSPFELYFLVLSCLFHDVGNVFERKGHKTKLKEAYEFAKGTSPDLASERSILFRIVDAHGGLTPAGSPDTLKALGHSQFLRHRVDLRRVAAVLRFADELAEGPQRTSLFMQKHLPFSADATKFHEYANATSIHIGRELERITVQYRIEIAPETTDGFYDKERVQHLIRFCFLRIQKLDRERRYNKHYCSFLQRFKRTEVSFSFFFQRDEIQIPLPQLILDDLVLPDSPLESPIEQRHPEYEMLSILNMLDEAVARLSQRQAP